MKSIRSKTRIRRKGVLAAVIVTVSAAIISLCGTTVMTFILEYTGNAVISLGVPVAEYYENAENIQDEDLVDNLIDEVYPARMVYQLTYNHELGNETSYSINVLSSSVVSTNTGNVAEPVPADENESDNNIQTDTDQSSADVVSRHVYSGNTYTREQLYNYSFTRKFYTVTSTTSLTNNILKPEEFLNKDMTISHGSETPQILIFHTHSQEGFVDSVEGDDTTTIVGVGDYLTELLTTKYGYNVIHDRTIYDYVDGKLDRSKAYTYAERGIEAILNENPDIDVVIDLHRDGVSENTRLVTDIDGKRMAKVMLFNGISYSNACGDITYLNNPYRDDNLAMSLQMHLLGEAYYPGFLRNIYINAYRYCLHERGKSMLIEAGAQTNTYEEVKLSMEPLADLLDKLLKGEKAY